MKLDILAFGAHPDDVELSASGTLRKMSEMGYSTGIVDLTRGEMGTRGTPELREEEAKAAGEILGVKVRENLGLPDGFLQNTREFQMAVIPVLRKYQPDVILVNAIRDRHPDHGNGSKLVRDAAFLSGLRKIETEWEGEKQEAWRPGKVFFYIQDELMIPDFVVDISGQFEHKLRSIKAYASQFFDPKSDEPLTYISTKDYWDFIESRNREIGHLINATYGEGFLAERPVKVKNLLDLV